MLISIQAFLLFCFSAFLLFCFSAFLLFCFSAFSVGAIAGVPLGDQFDIYAKLGIAFWSLDLSLSLTDGVDTESSSADESGNDFYFGFGGKYRFNDQWALGAEYTMLDADVEVEGESGTYELDNLALQLSFSF